jgi:hypothetical protein
MAWEDLEADIAEEFSDNKRMGWIAGGFTYFKRTGRLEAWSFKPRRNRGYRPRSTIWRRGWRAKRRLLALLAGRVVHRCQGYQCHNLLAPMQRGAPQLYCSKRCGRRVAREERKCSAPKCPVVMFAHSRRATCSNACRQRAWYHRNGGTSGASGASVAAGGGASGPHE